MLWQNLCENPQLQDLPFKIELNKLGKIEMSPAKNIHGICQMKIGFLLNNLLPQGEIAAECAVQTSDNVKVAEVAWISPERYQQVKHEASYSIAPEICIEILSAHNTQKEMSIKKKLYFERGAQEFWLCDENGNLSFYNARRKLKKSQLVPDFPNHIEL